MAVIDENGNVRTQPKWQLVGYKKLKGLSSCEAAPAPHQAAFSTLPLPQQSATPEPGRVTPARDILPAIASPHGNLRPFIESCRQARPIARACPAIAAAATRCAQL